MKTIKSLISCGIFAGTLLFALPALAADAPAPQLDAFGDLPQIDDAQLSISGDNLAVVLANNGNRQVLLLDRTLAPKRSITIGDTKVRDVDWVGEEALMFTYSFTEAMPFGFAGSQAEFYRAIVAPIDPEKESISVFGDNRDMLHGVFGRYGTRQVNGQWVSYFGGVPLVMKAMQGYSFDHGRPFLYKVGLNNKPKQVAFSASENMWRDWLVDADGRVAGTFDVNRRVGDWQLRNAKDDVIASGKQPNGKASLVTLGRDGTSIVYSLEDPETNQNHWFEISNAGGNPTEILADVDIRRIYSERGTGRMIGYHGNSLNQKPVFFDPAKQSAVQKIFSGFFGKNVQIVSWSNDFERFVVRTDGNGDPGTWYVIEPGIGNAISIGSERPGISPEQVGAISRIEYKAQDGLDLDGILTLPPGLEAKNLPVVMLPHGGPSSYDEAAFDWWAQALASRGYAVFQPNFRGSTNKDVAFQRAGFGQWGKKMQTDISDGLAELAKRGIVDPKRACIGGASYGGYAALAGVTIQQGIYRCAVAVAPVSDISLMFKEDYLESGSSQMVKSNVLEELGPRSNFANISPRNFSARADAPILLIHGRDDTVVPYRQSKVMADALKDANKQFNLIDLENEDHWLSRAETRKKMLREMVAFLERHNPPN